MLDKHEQLAVIHGIRNGSREAWATLYDSYGVDVWRYVARLLGPDAAAVADVVQETFLNAARSARHFDPNRGTVWCWLVGIAHHRVSDHWRQANRATRLQQITESGNVDVRHWFDGETDAMSAAESRDRAIFVRKVLSELSADHAALLTAKYLDEWSLVEISTELGSTVESVKSRLARARREFRAKFEFMSKATEGAANRIATGERPTTEKQR